MSNRERRTADGGTTAVYGSVRPVRGPGIAAGAPRRAGGRWPAAPEAEAEADVLATLADDAPTLAPVPSGRRIRWVHVLGAGVDGFPLTSLGDRLLTCSRGAGGPGHRRVRPGHHAGLREAAPRVVDHRAARPRGTPPSSGGWRARTLGVIGLGAIGTEVARRALAFYMEVVGTPPAAGPSPVDGVALCPDLPTLLGRSDHVVVAAPATPATAPPHRRRRLRRRQARRPPGQRGPRLAGRPGRPDPGPRRRSGGRWPRSTWSTPSRSPTATPSTGTRRSGCPRTSRGRRPAPCVRTITCFTENLARYREGRQLLGAVDKEAGY